LGGGFFLAVASNSLFDGSMLLTPVLLFGFSALSLTLMTQRITLSQDVLESRFLFQTRRLHRNDIAGWCVIKDRYGYSLKVQPKHNTAFTPIKVGRSIKIDGYFKAWIEEFPNLTATRMQTKLDQLSNRDETAPKAREVADRLKALNKSSLAASLPLFMSPEEMKNVILHNGDFDRKTFILRVFNNSLGNKQICRGLYLKLFGISTTATHGISDRDTPTQDTLTI
jgi:hypothetical protein